MNETNAELYNRSASNWQRSEPILLSDFTARPFLLSWCEPVKGQRVLDLGCGEGYIARQLKKRGAGRVEGIDISEEMIAGAIATEQTEPLGIRYQVGDASQPTGYDGREFDLVVAVFLFNYVDREQMTSIMKEVFRILRPGGRFVFSVPHPCLPFLHEEQPPFYFKRDGAGYFSARDKIFEGRIWRRDGTSVPVRCVHKTLDDYFHSLATAGFTSLPAIRELYPQPEHLHLDPEFFASLKDKPLHLAFNIVS
ncbi:MAG: methyltransferase domain-containing protein [Fuerstiella sp.]|nr:methyltransferase domain-containing protein [Fuerstiella sp.]